MRFKATMTSTRAADCRGSHGGRLVVKFGDKRRYSDQEREAIHQELVAAGLDDVARRPRRNRSGVQGAQCRRRGCGGKALFQRLSRQCSQADRDHWREAHNCNAVVAQAGARGRPANALVQARMALVARGVLSLIGLRDLARLANRSGQSGDEGSPRGRAQNCPQIFA